MCWQHGLALADISALLSPAHPANALQVRNPTPAAMDLWSGAAQMGRLSRAGLPQALRTVYPLLHKMLRESGFGANYFTLLGSHGLLTVKVSFQARTVTPSAVSEQEALVLSVR